MRDSHLETQLSERQQQVLRALVGAYVASAEPVSSATVSYLLPVALSTASIRNTMAELEERGLIHKPHASSGRIPTASGLRIFVDELLIDFASVNVAKIPRSIILDGLRKLHPRSSHQIKEFFIKHGTGILVDFLHTTIGIHTTQFRDILVVIAYLIYLKHQHYIQLFTIFL